MPSIFDDIIQGGRNIANDFQRSFNSIGTSLHDGAESLFSNAQSNVASLLGSGVNSNNRVTGPLGEEFGRDPVEFVLNSVREMKRDFVELCKRCAERTGRAAFEVPTPDGSQASIPARPSSSTAPAMIALTAVLHARANAAVFLEEASRMGQGLAVKRGLDGPYTWYPPLPVSRARRARGIAGIDDAILLGGIVTIICSLIAAVGAPLLLALVAAAGATGQAVIETASGVFNGLFGTHDPPPPSFMGVPGLDQTTALVLVAAVAVGGYLLWKRA